MEWPFTVEGTVVIIGTVGTQIVLMINAIRSQVKQATIEKKVDTVHELTNSRLSRIEGELAAARTEAIRLMALLQANETTRVALARDVESAQERKAIREEARQEKPPPPPPPPRNPQDGFL